MASSTLPEVTRDEAMFLHTVLSRDQGRARALHSIPSPRIASLVKKRLVDFVPENDGFVIVMTPLGLDVAEQPFVARE